MPQPTWAANSPLEPARTPTPEEARDTLLAYAFRALGARALTATELRGKLERRSDDEALVQEVLERVQELGYQDDAQVAQVEGTRRGIGGFRVRQTLKRRGVTAPLIEETMLARDPDDEQAAATEVLEPPLAQPQPQARSRVPVPTAFWPAAVSRLRDLECHPRGQRRTDRR